MLKSGYFKVEVQLIAEEREYGSALLNQSRIRLDRSKIAGPIFSAEF